MRYAGTGTGTGGPISIARAWGCGYARLINHHQHVSQGARFTCHIFDTFLVASAR